MQIIGLIIEGNSDTDMSLDSLLNFEQKRAVVSRVTEKWLLALYQRHFQGHETVLEVGSGLGYFKRKLPKHNGIWVQLDSNPVALKEARHKDSSGRGIYVAGTGLLLPFEDESFDVVCGFNCYDLLAAFGDEAFTEARRVLKKGGLFLHTQDLLIPLIVHKNTGEEYEIT